MPVLELKVPPVAVVLVTAALMWLVARAVPAFGFVFPARDFLALSLAGAGAVVSLSGVVLFKRAKTSTWGKTPGRHTALIPLVDSRQRILCSYW
jgi:hypothetical protein